MAGAEAVPDALASDVPVLSPLSLPAEQAASAAAANDKAPTRYSHLGFDIFAPFLACGYRRPVTMAPVLARIMSR
ncbi:hypothetical protein MCHIJ_39370 [Mycolicibacterium chitae]|nr:hypothetical protein MCHIJ_39370 [Mycolicibacterium chitae]